LSRVKWDKRRVLIVFDRDVVTNDKVAIARRMLAKELTRRGALVQDIDIPDAGGVKGIDDLIGTWGPEKVLNLLLEVLDNPKTAKTGAAPNSLVPEIEQHLKRSYHFARDAGGLLYVFEGGVYRPSAENLIKREVKEYCREFNKIWTPELASKLVEYLAADAPELLERPPLDTLNVLNGLLDVTTRTLAAHSPDFLSPVQLPVAFDPEARCPAIDKFCSEVLPDDAQHVIGEIAAWLMLPETSIQKAVLLIGEGANGKSVFLTLLADFLGRENTCSLSLHKIESDKFAAARLVGKLANICPDLPTAALSGTSMFKALTGGDQINAERKYQPSFEFRPFARLVFSANTPPRSDDATHGFFRRWINLPFERRTFNENDAATIPSAILRARLSAPAEVSGLLNRALDSLPQIRTGRLQESESMRNALANFRATTDPLAVWLDRHTVEVPGSVTPKRLIREAYAKDSQDAGRPVVPDNVFTSRLKQLRPHVSTAQRTVNRKVTECFIGIAPRCEGWDTEPAGFASQMPLQEAA
jgi:putative DNA primase/helicase